jgi:hypothetical protein
MFEWFNFGLAYSSTKPLQFRAPSLWLAGCGCAVVHVGRSPLFLSTPSLFPPNPQQFPS